MVVYQREGGYGLTIFLIQFVVNDHLPVVSCFYLMIPCENYTPLASPLLYQRVFPDIYFRTCSFQGNTTHMHILFLYPVMIPMVLIVVEGIGIVPIVHVMETVEEGAPLFQKVHQPL